MIKAEKEVYVKNYDVGGETAAEGEMLENRDAGNQK